MKPEAAKRLRLLASVISLLVILVLGAAGWFYQRLRASLPQLEGTATVAGLGAAVTIQRDALGVPKIRGENRPDVARALGWLHAQDRFFQMDLLRRSSAGELAELFGQRALPRDRAARMHGFRTLAQQVVAALPPPDRAILEAYVAGVNAGLAALGARPFEYLVQRETPQPWRAEDCILVAYAMTLDLQDETGGYEQTLMTLRDQLGPEALAFFAPLQTPTDAALDGSTAPLAPIPGPRVIDLRKKSTAARGSARPDPVDRAHGGRVAAATDHAIDPFPFPARDPDMVIGSNVFALAGAHTANGAAMVANDMHLRHGVPNIWYRASLEFPAHQITGVTIPGTPVIVAGSNGRVAWGFTNSYADTGDLVVVDINRVATSLYTAPGHEQLLRIESRPESIRIKGGKAVQVVYPWTIWGPVVGTDEMKRPLAYRWTAHDPAAANLGLLAMEEARDIGEAIAVAHCTGMPAQNLVVADGRGAIAWTIAGQLPRRVGYDGRLPVPWTYGDRRWDGFVPAGEVPVVIPSAGGRIWSANQRHVGGAALAKLGDSGYARPSRAAQIRDDLAALERATPRDLLAVQLDDRALFLAPWHQLLLDTLTPAVTAAKKNRTSLRASVEKWEGRAQVGSVSYHLVREFRTAVHARMFRAIFASCLEAFPEFRWRTLHLEGAAWALLRARPAHLLSPDFPTWDDLLVAAADDVVEAIEKQGVTLAQASWGRRNTARIRHPFSASFPWLGTWLDLPADPLPGDNDMPRVQSPTSGASERFVVSPGHEAEGIFHMPGGQSGHPLSPYFRAGHSAWVRGEPTPFLPGKPEHTLVLRP